MKKLLEITRRACMPEMASIPEFHPGDTINVHFKLKEKEKERIQQFQGTIIRIQGEKRHLRTVVVRKVTSGIGVERIFTVPSPSIANIEVQRKAIVRRANLSYLQKLKGEKKAKLKYKI